MTDFFRTAFLGGNGHCSARLEPARAIVDGAPWLVDIPYPGFEGQPRAANREMFLSRISRELENEHARQPFELIYATGIGSLIALHLRTNGVLADVPLVMQGPVLWGVKHRWLPRVMRIPPLRAAMPAIMHNSLFQQRFFERYFTRLPSVQFQSRFFEGYRQCSALSDLFAWFDPAFLDQVARRASENLASLENVSIWMGEQDRVVSQTEVDWTEQGLHHKFPVRRFETWGHYPMIDEPHSWIGALQREVAHV